MEFVVDLLVLSEKVSSIEATDNCIRHLIRQMKKYARKNTQIIKNLVKDQGVSNKSRNKLKILMARNFVSEIQKYHKYIDWEKVKKDFGAKRGKKLDQLKLQGASDDLTAVLADLDL